jgi:flagellar hook assembly protein FlgD
LPADGYVTLAVYDLRGRLVCTLVEAFQRMGEHGVIWDGRDDAGRSLASGSYLVRLRGDESVLATIKLQLVR